jgi:CRP-like cAMP-binding protein
MNPIASRNRLLDTIPRGELEQLEPDLEPVRLAYRAKLHEPTGATPYVHFPDSGVLSLLTVLADGSAVELGHVGNEGMVDISVFLGLESSESRTVVQVPGSARRMPAPRFREHIEKMPNLRRVIGAYVLEFHTMVAQTTACNRRHDLHQRFARWVLMTHDRVGGPEFPITQEFLADMLGASRSKVALVAEELKAEGVIRYRRGTMRVVDREALERTACECYALIWERFARFERPPEVPWGTESPERMEPRLRRPAEA